MIATTIASVADADADYAVWTCTFGVAGASAAMMRSTAADSRHAFAIACNRAASGANATTEGPEPETKACVAPACNAARTAAPLRGCNEMAARCRSLSWSGLPPSSSKVA